MEWIRDAWWIIGIAAGFMAAAARAGWRSRQMMARLERLERHDSEQKRDISALLAGMFAVLDGLKQQGCNGEVTSAYARLKQYVVDRR